MTDTTHSLLIEADRLEDILYSPDILIVDLGKADTYRKLHLPGAVFVDYGQIVAVNKPAMGLLPDDATLQRVFSSLGIESDTASWPMTMKAAARQRVSYGLWKSPGTHAFTPQRPACLGKRRPSL
jgi:hypothetical protein